MSYTLIDMELQLDAFDARVYPPANRFMVTFTSRHLTDRGGVCSQGQRRFILADNANDAREYFRLGELADKRIWDGHFHRWENLHVDMCPGP